MSDDAARGFTGDLVARGCSGMIDGVCPNRDTAIAVNLNIAEIQVRNRN